MKQPADAATLIIVDRSTTPPRILLGRRHERHVFMPGKFVFPGGRLEPDDSRMPVAEPLPKSVETQLLQQVEGVKAPHAFALAAIRETFEEAGLLLGIRAKHEPVVPAGIWSEFANIGYLPDLSRLHFITRAITPPGFPRRFDARFFAADAEAIGHRIENVIHDDAELVELRWVSIAEAQAMDLPMITHIVLDELQDRVAAGFGRDLPVPFYRMQGSYFERGLL
jgi:8-oxo-dGTP pyrophosphatase MutT (NUDIX family)